MGRTASKGKKHAELPATSRKSSRGRTASVEAVKRSHKAKTKRNVSDSAAQQVSKDAQASKDVQVLQEGQQTLGDDVLQQVIKKRGRKSDWPDAELAFFESWLPTYAETDGNRDGFWVQFFAAFFRQFPKYMKSLASAASATSAAISLELGGVEQAASSPSQSLLASAGSVQDNTPPQASGSTAPSNHTGLDGGDKGDDAAQVDDGGNAGDANDADKVGEGDDGKKLPVKKAIEDLTWEELERKSRNWFYNHRKDNKKAVAWQPWIKEKLSKPQQRTVRIPPYKCYMSHPDHVSKIEAEFNKRFLEDLGADSEDDDSSDEEDGEADVQMDVGYLMENWDDLGSRQKRNALDTHAIALRCAVAKELFDSEPKELCEKIKAANEEAYNAKKTKESASKNTKAAIATAAQDPRELIELRQENMVPITQTWADEVSAASGMHVSVFFGKPPTQAGEKYTIESVHAGTNKAGKTWDKHDRERVKKATKCFFSFLESCSGAENAKPKTPPEDQPKESSSKKGEDGRKEKKKKSKAKGKAKEKERSKDHVSGTAGPSIPSPATTDIPLLQPSSVPTAGTPQAQSGTQDPSVSTSTHLLPQSIILAEKEHVTTPEGGPNRDPANPPKPKERPQPTKIPSKPKKMSARLKKRLVESSEEDEGDESGGDESGEGDGQDKNGEQPASPQGTTAPHSPVTILSFNPSDPQDLFQDDSVSIAALHDGYNAGLGIPLSPGLQSPPSPSLQPPPSPSLQPPPSPSPQPLSGVADVSSHTLRHGTADNSLTPRPPSLHPMDIDDEQDAAELPPLILAALKMVPDGDQGEWASEALAVLTSSESMVQQPVWQHIIHQFIDLQSVYSFTNIHHQRLPGQERPLIFKRWFKEGRKVEMPLPFPPLQEFSDGLWSWWRILNPEWRERIGEKRMSRAQAGDWNGLRFPGQNGLLLPIVGLRWWYLHEEKEGGSADWRELAEDVLWVLESIIKWERENPQPLPPPSSQKPPSSRVWPTSTAPPSMRVQKPKSSQRKRSDSGPSTQELGKRPFKKARRGD
ncbi:hypothetical protein VNI00_015843 [Paramarasmius palmivorus]|uniref:Uncharacterized protein n=1 Tax=Paramarasmius palmivorus TaxID=297713 RepID=A0AAW0BI46_9AGAR